MRRKLTAEERRTKNRVTDAIYRMKKAGFDVPANIREKITVKPGARYEEIYAEIAPWTTYKGEGGREPVSGLAGYAYWKEQRLYNAARTRAGFKGRKLSAVTPGTQVGPGKTQAGVEGLTKEEAERRRVQDLQKMREMLKAARLADRDDRERAKAEAAKETLLQVIEVQLDGRISSDLYDEIINIIKSTPPSDFMRVYDSRSYSKAINSIYRYDEGLILTGESGQRNAVGGNMTPIGAVLGGLGHPELEDELQKIGRADLLASARGTPIVRTRVKRKQIAREERRKREKRGAGYSLGG